MKNFTVKTLSGFGLSLLMGFANAGNITDITVRSVDDSQKIVKIQFDKGGVVPQGFMFDTPPRITLDFASTGLKLKRDLPLQFNDPLIGEISTASDAERARVVLRLNQQAQYTTEMQSDGSLLVRVRNTQAKSFDDGLTHFEPTNIRVAGVSTAANVESAVEMQFTKAGKEAGVINFTIPATHSEPKVERTANALNITFPNVALLPSAQRSYDVSEYGTPARKVSIKRMGNDTKVEIITVANWDYSVKDYGSRYTVNITRQADLFSDLNTKPASKSFKGNRITLDFQDVDVRTILQILAKESGMNIVASDTVQGKMTLNLKDVPWDQALDLVMQARNLDMRKQGNIINIAPRAELLEQDRQVMRAQKELSEIGTLYSRTFQLKYKSVEDFRQILDTSKGSSNSNSGENNTILSARGSVMIDPGTNTLIVTDNQEVLNKFDKLIAQLDIPVRQVLIEARIVEANDGFARDLGVRWGGSYTRGEPRHTGNNYIGNTTGGSQDSGGVHEGILPNINLPAVAATSTIGLVRKIKTKVIALELTAMQEQNKGKIVSSPRVLTQDRKEALLEEGQDVPYQEASSSGATSTTFKKAVTGLTVKPQITPDGNVIMELKINKDEVDQAAGDGRMNVKRLETTAMVENGGTMIVGGIYVENDSEGVAQVPLFGDIPLVGNLFKSRSVNKSRRELLIFITPHIIDTLGSSNIKY